MEANCVKTAVQLGGRREEGGGGGHRWQGVRAVFALVLANKHINSKVDNQEGGGRDREGAASSVKRAVQRGSSHGQYKV